MVKTKVESRPRVTSERRHDVYNYEQRINYVFSQIEKEFSSENLVLIQKYDKLMVSLSMAKTTREKHLKTILNLNRFYENKNWEQISKEDVLELVCKICYLKWIARQSNNATRRIEFYANKTKRKPIHLILIVNPNQQYACQDTTTVNESYFENCKNSRCSCCLSSIQIQS